SALAPLIAATPSSSRAILAPTLPKVLTPKRAISAAPTQEESGGRKNIPQHAALLRLRSEAKYRDAVPQRKKIFPPRKKNFRAACRRAKTHRSRGDGRQRRASVL